MMRFNHVVHDDFSSSSLVQVCNNVGVPKSLCPIFKKYCNNIRVCMSMTIHIHGDFKFKC